MSTNLSSQELNQTRERTDSVRSGVENPQSLYTVPNTNSTYNPYSNDGEEKKKNLWHELLDNVGVRRD